MVYFSPFQEKILRSVATKVLLQMNCKLGGSPWDARIPFKREGVAMIVGVDTFVDAKQASKSTTKVNGALVASYDPQATKWFRYARQKRVIAFLLQNLILFLPLGSIAQCRLSSVLCGVFCIFAVSSVLCGFFCLVWFVLFEVSLVFCGIFCPSW